MSNTYSQTWFELFLETQLYTEQEVAFVGRHLPRPRYRRVLDVCCGSGRHSRPLAEQGYEVVGIDRDVVALANALAKARSSTAVNATYLHQDMRRLEEVPGQFDAVLSLWQSFGYFDEATNRDVLRQMSEKLRPNGRLILDIYNRTYFERNQGTRQLERNGVLITAANSMKGNRLRATLDYGDGGDTFEWQLFTPDEICELAAEFVLEVVLMCTEFDEKKPVTPEKPRMIFVFRKERKER
jgi:SAM-dependent methyltransferase